MADLPRADRLAAAIERATVDHVIPRLKGGPAWLENEVAALPRGAAPPDLERLRQEAPQALALVGRQ